MPVGAIGSPTQKRSTSPSWEAVTSPPKLELFGALDIARNWLDIDDRFDNDYTTVHLVPGIEYALSNNLDLVAEIGIGLNNDSSNYVSGGIAFYIR